MERDARRHTPPERSALLFAGSLTLLLLVVGLVLVGLGPGMSPISATPSLASTSIPTSQATPSPTPTASAGPTRSSTPSASPTPSPTQASSPTPSPSPTGRPTATPTMSPIPLP